MGHRQVFSFASEMARIISSLNYKWLSEKVSNFAYTDRICVDESRRGLKIGEKLYRALFEHFEDTGRSFCM